MRARSPLTSLPAARVCEAGAGLLWGKLSTQEQKLGILGLG